MQKIQRVSKFFRMVFQLLFALSPVEAAIAWVNAPNPLIFGGGVFQFNAIPPTYQTHILHSLSASEKLFGFLVGMLPLAITMVLLYCLIKLFRLFEQGEIFTLGVVGYIRKAAYVLLIGQALNPAYEFLMGIVLTLGNPPGQRMAKITFSHNNLGIILIALMILLISWIMTEGCKLSDEQRLVI